MWSCYIQCLAPYTCQLFTMISLQFSTNPVIGCMKTADPDVLFSDEYTMSMPIHLCMVSVRNIDLVNVLYANIWIQWYLVNSVKKMLLFKFKYWKCFEEIKFKVGQILVWVLDNCWHLSGFAHTLAFTQHWIGYVNYC